MFKTFQMELAGRPLIIETGKMAKQANGAVLVRYGDTVVLVATTASKEPREGTDFFPLTVDYEEKMYAVGKMPGGFLRREGRPGNSAILNARLIDRPIRPLLINAAATMCMWWLRCCLWTTTMRRSCAACWGLLLPSVFPIFPGMAPLPVSVSAG